MELSGKRVREREYSDGDALRALLALKRPRPIPDGVPIPPADPTVVPLAVRRAVPRAVPRAVSRAVPRAVPGAVPRAVPGAVPGPVPGPTLRVAVGKGGIKLHPPDPSMILFETVKECTKYCERYWASLKPNMASECPKCQQNITRKSNFTEHMVAVHTEEAPFKCPMCERGVSRLGDIGKHITTLHGGFHCAVCDRKVIGWRHFEDHLHGDHEITIKDHDKYARDHGKLPMEFRVLHMEDESSP